MSWAPSSLRFNSIDQTSPEFLQIVESEKSFCTQTYFWGLISYTSNTLTPTTPIENLLQNTITAHATATAVTPKFTLITDYDNSPALKAVNKFIEYFNTPLKIITCTEPDEYMYGVKSVCDGIFESFVTKMGKTSNNFKYNIIIMEMINRLNEKMPFPNTENGTLESFMKYIRSYLTSVFVPSQYSSDFTSEVKAVVYACYYPFFVFMYILSFIPTANKTIRKDLSFQDTRNARLACYLFVSHMSAILSNVTNQYITLQSDSNRRNEFTAKRTLLHQILGNVSLNVLGKESTDFESNSEQTTEKLNNLSKSNVEMNKQLLIDNERYERYKQNLISAANNEKSLDTQLTNASRNLNIHIAILCSLIGITIIILVLPKNLVPYDADLITLNVICAGCALYIGIMGIINVVNMLS